ncbi:hypothetical protein ACSLBF_06430 [Pseudoalteromonas sp. T1lg65]|uniref:hypothetical protein n=1 Tax=Pseudoalteromonas sp. T1lg65 TaxID=2077101 RepID=UPI003F7B0843
MGYVVFFTLALLITLLAVYLVIESNRRKAIEAEKKAFNKRLKEITSHFKVKVAEFVDAKILRPKYAPQINAIVSNFFVVQAHNQENLDQLERVSEQFLHKVSAELNKCRALKTTDLLAEQLQYFVAELPSSGIAYNRDFYREILPALIARIQTPDLELPVEDEIESEDEDNPKRKPASPSSGSNMKLQAAEQ